MSTDYDTFAESYSRQNDGSLLHRYYERPAILELLGGVEGLRVLDVGCGSGPLMADLRERGAEVGGFDLSAGMIEIARERLGSDVDLHVADLAEPLPFADDAYDAVVASLSLHYVPDWSGPLAELRRVLRPGGRLVVSVPHPAAYLFNYQDRDYFRLTEYSETFTFSGVEGTLTYWHRPLHAMTDAFTEAGFGIRRISEPPFDPDTPRELLPEGIGDREAFVCFLFFVLEAPGE